MARHDRKHSSNHERRASQWLNPVLVVFQKVRSHSPKLWNITSTWHDKIHMNARDTYRCCNISIQSSVHHLWQLPPVWNRWSPSRPRLSCPAFLILRTRRRHFRESRGNYTLAVATRKISTTLKTCWNRTSEVSNLSAGFIFKFSAYCVASIKFIASKFHVPFTVSTSSGSLLEWRFFCWANHTYIHSLIPSSWYQHGGQSDVRSTSTSRVL